MHMVNSFLKNECKTKFEVLIRPNQLLRQHNWAVFSALVLLYELSFPAGETPEKGTEYNKFFRVSVDTLQTKKSLVNLMDDISVNQHLLLELNSQKNLDKENKTD
jgi:hypothetical protein